MSMGRVYRLTWERIEGLSSRWVEKLMLRVVSLDIDCKAKLG